MRSQFLIKSRCLVKHTVRNVRNVRRRQSKRLRIDSKLTQHGLLRMYRLGLDLDTLMLLRSFTYADYPSPVLR